jgi:hypothetical protein
VNSSPCFDLIVADILDGLPVLNVSESPSHVPAWNLLNEEEMIEPIFKFASEYVHDDGAILLFHPENGKVKEFTLERADTYGFCLLDSWMGVNELKLSSYKKSKRWVSFIEFFHL